MKIQAKIFQESIRVNYFLDGAEVQKRRDDKGKIVKDSNKNAIWEFCDDGETVENGHEDIERVSTGIETFSLPINGRSNGKKLTKERLKEVCEEIADSLVFAAETSRVNGRKFTRFSLNKPIQIMVKLDETSILQTKELRKEFENLFTTFRMVYTQSNGKTVERKTFTKEELSNGIHNIFLLSDRVNKIFEF